MFTYRTGKVCYVFICACVLTVCGRKRFLILFLSFSPRAPFIATVWLLSLQHTPAFAAHHALYWTSLRKNTKRENYANTFLINMYFKSVHTCYNSHAHKLTNKPAELNFVLKLKLYFGHTILQKCEAFTGYERRQGLQNLKISPNLEYQTERVRKERERVRGVRFGVLGLCTPCWRRAEIKS